MLLRILCASILSGMALPSWASPQYSLMFGAFENSGDYGDNNSTSTHMAFAPLTFKAQTARWSARLQTSWISIDGPGNLGEGVSRVANQTHQSGLGDSILGFDLRSMQNRWLIEPGIRIKLPTADEAKALGTGSRDYSFQVSATGAFPVFRPFSSVGYKWRGHSDLVELKNSGYATLGIDWLCWRRLSLGAGYDWRQASTAGRPPGKEVFAYSNWTINKNWRLMLYSAIGFSDSSADHTLGLQTTYNW